MEPRIKIDSQWFSQLAERYPQAAEQLRELSEHLFAKQERLVALIMFCAAHPELPMMRMYAEYSAALDVVALELPNEQMEELTAEVAALNPHQRAARTKTTRTQSRVIETVVNLILDRQDSWTREEVADLSGVGLTTVYRYYNSREKLLAAAYSRLLAND